MYAEEGDLMRTLQSGIRVAAYANAEGAEVVVRGDPLFHSSASSADSIFIVPDLGRPRILQATRDTWAREDLEHA